MNDHRERGHTVNYRISIARLLLIGLFAAAPLGAQGADPAAYYRRCVGMINKSYPVVMHVQKRDGRVSGWYYYQKRREVLFLEGKVDGKGDVTLDEFPRGADREEPKNRTGRFIGRGAGKSFSGAWRSADGKKSHPFEVNEAYDNESIRLTPYRLHESVPLFPDRKGKDAPAVTVDLRPLFPAGDADSAPLAAIRRALTGSGGDKSGREPAPKFPDRPEPYLRALRDSYVEDYRSMNADVYEPNGSNMWSWENERSSSVVLNDSGLLCLSLSGYDYTGGAHPNSYGSFLLFDLGTGRKLAAVDVFLPGSEEKLIALIEAGLRRNYEIAPGEPLSEAGFFADSVPLAGEFYVTVDGIGFYYNAYEIAPYALGPSDVFLPWAKVAPFVRPDAWMLRLMQLF